MYNLDLARKWPLLFRDLSLARWAESPPELESQARCLLPSLQGACPFVHLPVLLLSAITWVQVGDKDSTLAPNLTPLCPNVASTTRFSHLVPSR